MPEELLFLNLQYVDNITKLREPNLYVRWLISLFVKHKLQIKMLHDTS